MAPEILNFQKYGTSVDWQVYNHTNMLIKANYGLQIFQTEPIGVFCCNSLFTSFTKNTDQWFSRWALGILLFNMLTGRPPFKAKGEEVFNLIRNNPLVFPEHIV